jgi:predicted amidophosphoribosyltransferase
MAVPAFDTGTCLSCAGPTHAGFAMCFCCSTLVRQLQMPLAPAVAMTEYRLGDPMHRHLRGYKDAPVAEGRQRHLTELVAVVDPWLEANRAGPVRRFGARWDLVVTVPSSHRPAGCPVDALVARLPELARWHRPVLARGPVDTDHLTASRRGFEVVPDVDPHWLRSRRVLVFDDTIITGARAQSAVAALRMAGARVVGVLAVGRVVPGRVVPGRVVPAQLAPASELAPGRSRTRPGPCSYGSSPNPSRVPVTTSCWR